MAAFIALVIFLAVFALVAFVILTYLLVGNLWHGFPSGVSYLRLVFRQYKWALQTGRPAKDYLIERYHDLITKRLSEIRFPSDLTREVLSCIDAIGEQEGYKEYLAGNKNDWEHGNGIPRAYRRLWFYLNRLYGDKISEVSQEFEILKTERAGQEKLAEEIRRKELFDRNSGLIHTFLAIAERKVSSIDDYGDENWDVLPVEIAGCLKKIAQREGKPIDWRESQKLARERKSHYLSWGIPKEYQWLGERLDQLFREYHQEQKSKSTSGTNFDDLSGVEFETRIANILKQHGFLDVRGTPTTGDQGADLIAKENGQTIVIQAKRYQGVVGNKAVQEVVAALHFYGGNEGWVITNSTFSPSAKELAQRSGVTLIDGYALRDIGSFLHKWRAGHA